MEQERRVLRWGLAVIVCAVVLRLAGAMPIKAVTAWVQHPDVASFLVYLQTGRVVRLSPAQLEAGQKNPQETTQQTPFANDQVVFDPSDADAVSVMAYNGYKADVETLLMSPLQWDLTKDGPAVLIIHTHATESYRKAGQDYAESAPYRTHNTDYNMVRIGKQIAENLESRGIGVIHDTQFHDYPSYNDSYTNARKSIQEYLKQYPSIRVVLDIHRDAAEDAGHQLTTSAQVGGQKSSQLMFVVGTNAGGLYHPNWQENMALAIKLQALLERENPGICRPISFRTERFNQDLSTGALIVEVGAAGDTLEQALIASDSFCAALGQLGGGTATKDSTS